MKNYSQLPAYSALQNTDLFPVWAGSSCRTRKVDNATVNSKVRFSDSIDFNTFLTVPIEAGFPPGTNIASVHLDQANFFNITDNQDFYITVFKDNVDSSIFVVRILFGNQFLGFFGGDPPYWLGGIPPILTGDSILFMKKQEGALLVTGGANIL